MSYYTDKVYSSNFLSKSRGLDEMLVQDSVEERPPLPESRQSRLEARLKETTARDTNTTSFTRSKREPSETVLYLGPSTDLESHIEVRDSRELRERKRKEESVPTIFSRSNRSLLEESRRSGSHHLNHESLTSYSRKTSCDAKQNNERSHRPVSMSRTIPPSGQTFSFKDESPSRPSSALGTYSSYNTRRSLAPEGFERRREEKASTYSSCRMGKRGEEIDWLPSSSSSRLLVRGDQRSGVEIFPHRAGGSDALTNVRRLPVDQSHYHPPKEEPAQYHTDRTFPSRFLTSNPGIEQMIVRRDSR